MTVEFSLCFMNGDQTEFGHITQKDLCNAEWNT